MSDLRLTIWHEYRTRNATHMPAKGIHGALAKGLAPYGFDIGTATLDEPEHGLTQDVLDNTDV